MFMKRNRLKLIAISFFLLINQIIFSQLDPLPGDPLPGDPDPGIEVPLDLPIVLAILGIGGFLVVFFIKRKQKAQKPDVNQ